MKKIVKVKNIEIGRGMPKICVSIIGRTEEEILEKAKIIIAEEPDIIEWRVDWYDEVGNVEKVIAVLSKLRKEIIEYPLIFTFRTKEEGGDKEISFDDYADLNLKVAKTGLADLIDVELKKSDQMPAYIEKLKEQGVFVITSNHNFQKTYTQKEIIEILSEMERTSADISKIAMMPQRTSDVLRLLEATDEMKTQYTKKPLITMSMAKKGVISRLAGEIFGSDVTFGAVGEVSAAGQVSVELLRKIINDMHLILENSGE